MQFYAGKRLYIGHDTGSSGYWGGIQAEGVTFTAFSEEVENRWGGITFFNKSWDQDTVSTVSYTHLRAHET